MGGGGKMYLADSVHFDVVVMGWMVVIGVDVVFSRG